jgi:methionyl-tRNA synthetase
MWVIGNEYLQKAEPWARIKKDPVSAGVSIRYALNLAVVFATLVQPFIPETAAKISQALTSSDITRPWPKRIGDDLTQLSGGGRIGVPEVLFAKIEDAQVEEWSKRFGGTNA